VLGYIYVSVHVAWCVICSSK